MCPGEDLGVNLADAEVVIRLNKRIRRMEGAYRDRMLPAVPEGED